MLHEESGTVLFAENADERLPMASTTKLMTALLAAESGKMDEEFLIEPEWTAVEGSSMFLRAGESYTLRELTEGLLLASGNDAAEAIAHILSGSTEAFAAEMNARAAKLGLTNTHFTNPHGLSDAEHFSSARDLAALMAAAMENADVADILAMRECAVHGTVYQNHNKLLGNCEGVDGGKTGYTRAAGRCLVTHCTRGGLNLICVTLADPDDWDDHAALYDWAYGTYTAFTLSDTESFGSVPVISGSLSAVEAGLAEPLTLCVPKTAGVTVKTALPPFIFAAVECGAPAGELCVYADGAECARCPLVWKESAARLFETADPFYRIHDRFSGIYYLSK